MGTGFFCTDNRIPLQVFFPDKETEFTTKKAKGYCAQCERTEDCLILSMDCDFGIWGGLTYNERRQKRIREALKASKVVALQQNTLHVQPHPVYVRPVSLVRTSTEQNHTQLVSLKVAGESPSYRVTVPKFL